MWVVDFFHYQAASIHFTYSCKSTPSGHNDRNTNAISKVKVMQRKSGQFDFRKHPLHKTINKII